jgi:uncharacterized protein (TIGR02145 family)
VRGTREIVLEWVSGIEELNQSDRIFIRQSGPNPFDGTTGFEIYVKKKNSVFFALYDELGNGLVDLEYKLKKGWHGFTIAVNEPGVYFLKVFDGKNSGTLKLINTKSSGSRAEIVYAGSLPDQPPLKQVQLREDFIFQPGDSLVYTIYAYGYETVSIFDTPAEDETYEFGMTPNLLDIHADTTRGNVPLQIQFFGITNMNINSWHWDFGDDSTSSLRNPVHIYMVPDTFYTVTLEAEDVDGNVHSVTKPHLIHAFPDPAEANFSADVTKGFAPQWVRFTSYSNFDAVAWQWSFGDGGTSTEQNPYHRYDTPGVYTVILTAYSNIGHKIIKKEDYIHIYECPSQMTDDNGNTYQTVQIHNQCWMKSNINVGIRIDSTDTPSDNGVIEKYCYHDDDLYCEEYGGLYTFEEAVQYYIEGPQGICPEGWHVPSYQEWAELVNFAGGQDTAGGRLKEMGWDHWDWPNSGASDLYGFRAYGAGELFVWSPWPSYAYLKKSTYFRTSTKYYFASLSNNTTRLTMYNREGFNRSGFSVRCVKNYE